MKRRDGVADDKHSSVIVSSLPRKTRVSLLCTSDEGIEGRRVTSALTVNSIARWTLMISLTFLPLYPDRKSPSLPIKWQAGWAPGEKTSCPCRKRSKEQYELCNEKLRVAQPHRMG
jgi:hypothetical protein